MNGKWQTEVNIIFLVYVFRENFTRPLRDSIAKCECKQGLEQKNSITNTYRPEVLKLEGNQEVLSKGYIMEGIVLLSSTNSENLTRMCGKPENWEYRGYILQLRGKYRLCNYSKSAENWQLIRHWNKSPTLILQAARELESQEPTDQFFWLGVRHIQPLLFFFHLLGKSRNDFTFNMNS